MFGAPQVDENEIEEDLGGREELDEDEEEDIPAANTPTDEEEDDNDGSGYGRASPFWCFMPKGE
jgi:hypothetical protein